MKRPRYVDGLDEVTRALARYKAGAPVKLTQALNKGAHEVAARARVLAPVEDGAVRDSIEMELDLKSRAGSSVASVVWAGGRSAPGAWRAEFGRDPGGAGPNATHPGHVAQPFLFPAYHSIRRRVRNRIKRAIRELGKEAAARNGR